VTRRADVRIIAATNVDLEKALREGRFREDLYYRLNVIQITLPPLRERPEDLVALAERLVVFFGRSCHRTVAGFTSEAVDVLRNYIWPGNIRELRNVIGERIDVHHLPENLRSADQSIRLGDPLRLDRIEEEHIRRILADARSLQEAADTLGIDQATLWRRRKQYGI
jgi:NtrC-family two-component system response regulator AlgB